MTSTQIADFLACVHSFAPSSRLQLITLLHANGPTPLGKLAGALQVTSSAITTLADTLERERLAKRIRKPDDRRTIWLDLTERGRELIEQSLKLQPA